VAWLRDLGVPSDEIPLMDEWIIARIIDPPRDEKGRLKIRPKGPAPVAGFERFRQKWTAQGMLPLEIKRLWDSGIRW
jgi:hypothetical protein